MEKKCAFSFPSSRFLERLCKFQQPVIVGYSAMSNYDVWRRPAIRTCTHVTLRYLWIKTSNSRRMRHVFLTWAKQMIRSTSRLKYNNFCGITCLKFGGWTLITLEIIYRELMIQLEIIGWHETLRSYTISWALPSRPYPKEADNLIP